MSTNCLLLYFQRLIFDICLNLLRINLPLFQPTSDPFRRLLHVRGHRARVRAGPDAAPWLGRGVREEGLGGTSSEPETSHAGQGKVFGAVVMAVLPSLELRFLFQGFEFRVLLAGFFRLHKVYLNFDLFYSRFISQLKILAKIYRINTIIWSNNITWLTFARFRLLLQIDPTCQNKKNRPLPRPPTPFRPTRSCICSCTPKSKSTASRRPPPCTSLKGKAPWRPLLTRPKVPRRQGPYATARRRHSADVTRNKRPPDPRTTGPEPFPNQFHAILILWVLFFAFNFHGSFFFCSVFLG